MPGVGDVDEALGSKHLTKARKKQEKKKRNEKRVNFTHLLDYHYKYKLKSLTNDSLNRRLRRKKIIKRKKAGSKVQMIK